MDACTKEIAAPGSVVEDVIWEEDLAAAYASHSNRERTIGALRQENCTWREVGQRLDLAGDTARTIYRRAVDRIREGVLAEGTGQVAPY